jgi:hypothetical protein
MPNGFSFPEKEANLIDLWIPRAFTSQELARAEGAISWSSADYGKEFLLAK